MKYKGKKISLQNLKTGKLVKGKCVDYFTTNNWGKQKHWTIIVNGKKQTFSDKVSSVKPAYRYVGKNSPKLKINQKTK